LACVLALPPISDPSTNDVELLARWREGDAQAGARLLGRHVAHVRRYLTRKLSDHAEDLVQDTFLAAIEHNTRYRGESSFRAFMLGIARNKLRMHLRDHPDPTLECPEQVACAAPTAPCEIDAARVREGLRDALQALPHEQRVALELHYWEQLDIATIARRLDVAPGTVKSRLARARERLREHIELPS
jgi:RNA polymerase sigma-70 factor (ECF subfamily)